MILKLEEKTPLQVSFIPATVFAPVADIIPAAGENTAASFIMHRIKKELPESGSS